MTDPDTHRRRYLAPAEVAEMLSLGVDEIIALVLAGELRGARLGSPARWRVEEDSVEDYLEIQHELARRSALWHGSQLAAIPEIWGAATSSRTD